jgi:hypothetical protein
MHPSLLATGLVSVLAALTPGGCSGTVEESPDSGSAAGSTNGHSHSSGGTGHGGAGAVAGASGNSGAAHGGTHAGGGSAGDTHGAAGSAHAFPPWDNYYEEYPQKYWHLLYDPAKHHGGGHADGSHPEDDCHTNPPTHEQIRAANELAVRSAQYVDTLPVTPDQASLVLPDHFLLGIPGINTTGYHYWDLAEASNQTILDPSNPEFVIYSETKTGFRPVGVMYQALPLTTEPGPDIGGCITQWHSHGGGFGDGYMMHVWTYGLETGPYSEPPPECGILSFCL